MFSLDAWRSTAKGIQPHARLGPGILRVHTSYIVPPWRDVRSETQSSATSRIGIYKINQEQSKGRRPETNPFLFTCKEEVYSRHYRNVKHPIWGSSASREERPIRVSDVVRITHRTGASPSCTDTGRHFQTKIRDRKRTFKGWPTACTGKESRKRAMASVLFFFIF